MTTISERLNDDLKTAMRAGDHPRRDVIRLLRSAFKNAEIEKRGTLDHDDELDVIRAEIKQRRDSIEAYEQGGRKDLAEKERAELVIIEEYLPADLKPMDEDEMRELVKLTIQELGLSGPGDMRTLMPALIQKAGGRADNRVLSKIAATELQNG